MDVTDHLTWQGVLGRITAVLALVLLNGFFVAAEFALVGARRSKLQEMTDAGDRLSKLALKALDHLDRYISATQLGITMASLALGWVGEPVVAAMIDLLLGQFGISSRSGRNAHGGGYRRRVRGHHVPARGLWRARARRPSRSSCPSG